VDVPSILQDGAPYDTDLDRFLLDLPVNGAYSGDRDQLIQSMAITHSGDRDHLRHVARCGAAGRMAAVGRYD